MALADLFRNILRTNHSVRPSISSMTIRLTSLNTGAAVLALALCVAGCGCAPKSNTSYVPASDSNPGKSGSSSSGTKSNTPNEGKPTVPKSIPDVLPKNFGEKHPVGSHGYKPSVSKMESIGDKMDVALKETKNAWGKVDTRALVDGAQLTGKASWKIRDKDEYMIEFYDPKTRAGMNRVIASGGRRVLYFNEKWAELPPPDKSGPGLNEDSVAVLPTLQLRLMLANFEHGGKVWGPIMRGLSKGTAGFKSTIEEQKMKILGKDRTLYRVLANRANDGASIEIVVDGESYLPVTLRTISKDSKGGQNTVLWTCLWNFGGAFKDDEFLIPVKAPGP